MLERRTALPSANREYGVFPAPFSCSSYRVLVLGFVLSNRLMARLVKLVYSSESRDPVSSYPIAKLSSPCATVAGQLRRLGSRGPSATYNCQPMMS